MAGVAVDDEEGRDGRITDDGSWATWKWRLAAKKRILIFP